MLAASAVAFQCFLKANAIWLSKAHWLDAKLGHLPGLPEVVAPDRSWLPFKTASCSFGAIVG
jgi:hypothetical protein